VGPRAGLDTEATEKTLTHLPEIELRSPGRPARSQTLYRLTTFQGTYRSTSVVLGGLVVSVLAGGPKVRGFKPGKGRSILMAIKIRSMPSFGGEVKPSKSCRNIE
jgi:hypothetical protein